MVDLNTSREIQDLFYKRIEEKISNAQKIGVVLRVILLLLISSVILLAIISNIPLKYRHIYIMILFFSLFIFLFLIIYFNNKVSFLQPSERWPLKEKPVIHDNEFVFYYLTRIKEEILTKNYGIAEKKTKELIYDINMMKDSYSDNPFTEKIFDNISKLESDLRTKILPSLKYLNEGILENINDYLNNVLYFLRVGDLDALSNTDIGGLISEEISLEDIYEPTITKKIYENIKQNCILEYGVCLLILSTVFLVVDYYALCARDFGLWIGRIWMVVTASATILALFIFAKKERH